MQSGALPNLFESALYCIKGVWSLTTNVYLYFSACKLRSKGKGDRREPIPPVSQVPPVGEIDTFLHHRSGCKKASTYGKMNLPPVAAVKKARHYRMFSRVPPRQRKGKASGAMRKQSGAKPIPPVFKYRLLARLMLFSTTGLAVKKHLPAAKRILPSVAAVKGVVTTLKYLHFTTMLMFLGADKGY